MTYPEVDCFGCSFSVEGGGASGLSNVTEGTLRSCGEGISVLVVGMCSGGLCDTAGGFLRACISEYTFNLSPWGWGASERASLNRAWNLYEGMPFGGCIRLDAVFADTGADDGDMVALV
jgi:hypothetical protein